MNPNNKNGNQNKNFKLRTNSTKIWIEGVELDVEITQDTQELISEKLTDLVIIKRESKKLQSKILNVSTILVRDDLTEEQEDQIIADAESLKSDLSSQTAKVETIYIDLINQIFINDSSAKCLELCKDSKGAYNVVTLSEAVTITLDYVLSKTNTALKSSFDKFKKA